MTGCASSASGRAVSAPGASRARTTRRQSKFRAFSPRRLRRRWAACHRECIGPGDRSPLGAGGDSPPACRGRIVGNSAQSVWPGRSSVRKRLLTSVPLASWRRRLNWYFMLPSRTHPTFPMVPFAKRTSVVIVGSHSITPVKLPAYANTSVASAATNWRGASTAWQPAARAEPPFSLVRVQV